MLPVIVPKMFEDEGRTCRNIGSVGFEEVGGRNGGQERIHSVDDSRNGGIAGVDGGCISGTAGRRQCWTRSCRDQGTKSFGRIWTGTCRQDKYG